MSSYDPFGRSDGPRGGGPFNTPPRRPPDDFGKVFQEKKGPILTLAIAAVVAAGVFSSYYQVEEGQLGVVLRFGEFQEASPPGLHFKIPFGVDRVQNLATELQQKQEFGFRTIRADVQSQVRRGTEERREAEMLTGDLNVATVEWVVQYKIDDPQKYLFAFRDVSSTLRLMSEATMRAVVGDYSFEELLTGKRDEIERKAKAALEKLNAKYATGIRIQHLALRDANAPDPVKPALREVEESKQERERLKKEAEADRNLVIPRARGLAAESIEKARGYATERVNEAKGDADRFNALYTEYKKAPEVTRTRLYIESMNHVMSKAKRKIMIDSNAKGLLPLLNLNEGKSQ